LEAELAVELAMVPILTVKNPREFGLFSACFIDKKIENYLFWQ